LDGESSVITFYNKVSREPLLFQNSGNFGKLSHSASQFDFGASATGAVWDTIFGVHEHDVARGALQGSEIIAIDKQIAGIEGYADGSFWEGFYEVRKFVQRF
jgi:hypothetical protein